VEENYKLIKEKVGLTDFRGYSENSVMQEFWISMLLTNLALAIKKETDGIIDCTINQKGNKNRYKTKKAAANQTRVAHQGKQNTITTIRQRTKIIPKGGGVLHLYYT